eukprot:4113624-Prymnesium_polylepis.1
MLPQRARREGTGAVHAVPSCVIYTGDLQAGSSELGRVAPSPYIPARRRPGPRGVRPSGMDTM